ncbi:MAG TPA: CDP-diacylglycerol--serine O-phosphatidyltransferase [Acidobacteriaceae bacterium]
MAMYEAEEEMQQTRGRRRRGMFILPSVFTSINIAFGYYAITQSLQGSLADPSHFDHAALAIGLAIPFDAIDGRIARMTKTTSDFGRELDSLADVITFGVAPSILAWSWGFRTLHLLPDSSAYQKLVALGVFVSFMFLICGACRLARFNISANPAPLNPGRPDRKYFVGMPIPGAAGVIAAVVHFFEGSPIYQWWWALVWMIFVGSVGLLMVSRWRFWSGKEINMGHRHPFQAFVLVAVIIALIVLYSQWSLILISLGYLTSGLLARAGYGWQRSRARRAV